MLSLDDAKRLAQLWRPRFPDEAEFELSWTRYMDSATVPDEARLEVWLAKDLAKFEVKHAGIVREPMLPVRQDLPDLPADLEARYIAAGDLHDFRNPLLSPSRHAAICPRCQAGSRSRQLVDDRAQATGKTAFPGFGALLDRLYERSRERCGECGAYDDESPADMCQRSFWHLPDIWLALHPDATLGDMGELGPFMRGFLKRQRPHV